MAGTGMRCQKQGGVMSELPPLLSIKSKSLFSLNENGSCPSTGQDPALDASPPPGENLKPSLMSDKPYSGAETALDTKALNRALEPLPEGAREIARARQLSQAFEGLSLEAIFHGFAQH